MAVGNGTNSIAYSSDGITWTGIGTSIFNIEGNGVAYGNGRWVAVGNGINSIAYSSDGITWTGRGISIFSSYGYGVAYGNGRWVAVGYGTNSIAYSSDGITWTGSSSGNSVFTTQGFAVAASPPNSVSISITGPNSLAISGNVTASSMNLTTSGAITAGSISALQFVESIVSLTYAASITAGFLSGTLISIPSVTSAITGLAITNIPSTANRSYSMVFILGTTVSSGYISTGSININGSAVSLKGTISASVPTTYIMQQVSVLNIGGTFSAVTSASFF